MTKRDDFNSETKESLAKRVGMLCSNPNCCAPTVGPRSESTKWVNVGVAAHIEGAAKGAARYNANQTSEERSSVENGIWLCQTHAKLIDNDPAKYTVSVLQHWKKQAEERAQKALENPKVISYSFAEPQSIVLVTRQRSTDWPAPKNINGKMAAPIRLSPIRAPRDVIDSRIPLVFDKNRLSQGQMLFSVTYQNTGLQIEEKIKIKITFNHAPIEQIKIDKEQRMHIIEGGGKGASSVTFYIPESLPNEMQTAQLVVSADIFPNVEFWTKQSHSSDEVFIYDIIF